MPSSLRLMCIGGFLGSGETTMMINLGKRFIDLYDKRVAKVVVSLAPYTVKYVVCT